MNGRVVASKGINGGFFVSSRYCSKKPSVPCPTTYGDMEVTRRFNRYFINNNNNKKKINIIAIININIDNNNKIIIIIIIIIHMKIQISYWLLSHNTDYEIACTSLFRKLLHFALLHYALEKLLQFASKDYYILRQCYHILR